MCYITSYHVVTVCTWDVVITIFVHSVRHWSQLLICTFSIWKRKQKLGVVEVSVSSSSWKRVGSIPVSTPGSLGASPVHVLGMLSLHLRWTLKRQSRHWRPCLKSPLRSLRQKWHTVGFVYEWTTNVCGILIRPAISFSIQKGRPALMEGRPCFWILGLVLPLDGLLDTLCKMYSRLRTLRRLWGSYGLTHYYAHDADCNRFITAGHGVRRAARQNIGWWGQKWRRQ